HTSLRCSTALPEQLKFFLAENDTPEVSPSVLWETAKAVSRGFTTSFSAHLKHKKEAEQRNLEQQLKNNPEVSMVRIIEIIKSFGQFLGYDINYSKSEAMPLTLHTPSTSSSAVPFRWSPSGFVYLGIHITLSLSGLYKANFIPLIRKIKEDLAHWTSLPLSPIGRVNLFKMNILPRLLYVFQMVPVLLTRRSLSILNSSLSSFLWRNKRARLKLQKLQLRVGDGGLSLPNIKYYQLACLGRYLWEWFRNDPRSTWLSIEATPLDPIPLRNILYTSKKWVANRTKFPSDVVSHHTKLYNVILYATTLHSSLT
uniref:Reverse transcriptase domain-containing protein n=1 Tax=Amphiprion ocellaris TaxID=80972 RepID=A0AAQ6A7C4_AMPOC